MVDVVAREDGDSLQPTHINDLPPEVLVNVFLYLTRQISCRAWLGVTHLCRYWWITALGSGALWSNILEDTPSVEAWLKRSNNHPLTIRLDLESQKSLPTLRITLRELPRIRQLHLTLTPSLWTAVSSYLKDPAPILESLLVERSAPDRHDTGLIVDFVLSIEHFAGTTPSLRTATFVTCALDLGSPIFHGLTSLTIKDPHDEPSPEDVLEALRLMPNLESLTLDFDWGWYEEDDDDDDPEPSSIVALPKLAEFTSDACLYGQMYLLSRLKFINTTTLILKSNTPNIRSVADTICRIVRAYDNARGGPVIPVRKLKFSRTTQILVNYSSKSIEESRDGISFSTSLCGTTTLTKTRRTVR
ncbi:hypothetical protein BDN72DRAFT_111794 [Pluteus cervinus]|uniref:Uncharacterized protein n=1 Tax=Pluteus cervinus TaxID=181527 RepID=A0ACD3APL0_9AGAR|nr:hypothetical protein BDN72DRAFT_111794 [Pluteus cervinus]